MTDSPVVTAKNETPAERAEPTRTGRVYRPNVDILELADELLVLADVPGVRAEDVDIHYEDRQLTIRGKVAPRPAPDRYLVHEYGTGDFERSFRVSEQIDASRITAECRDGVLTLHLPKAESAKPRRIVVQAR
jgi:HSP20 family molecular chaperone IbpA